MADSTIEIAGNLTRDPELRFTQGGKAVASFSVAVNKRFQQNGEWVDGPTTFFTCNAWEALGENLAASCQKGDRVIVRGRIESRAWETTEGEKRTSWEIHVEDVGCSFKFARATVERVRKAHDDSAPREQAPPPAAPGPYIGGDEEPFVSLYAGHQSYRNIHMEPGF
jgi:single-strand DNA-binding protein